MTRHAKGPSTGTARQLSAPTIVGRNVAVADFHQPAATLELSPTRRPSAKPYALQQSIIRHCLPGLAGAISNGRVAPATTNQPAGPGRRS